MSLDAKRWFPSVLSCHGDANGVNNEVIAYGGEVEKFTAFEDVFSKKSGWCLHVSTQPSFFFCPSSSNLIIQFMTLGRVGNVLTR